MTATLDAPTTAPAVVGPAPVPPRPLRVLGLDPSMTSTGLALVCSADPHAQPQVDGWAVQPKSVGHTRLEHLLTDVVRVARRVDLVVIEGLAPGVHDRGGQLAGLHWLLRHALWEEGVPVAVANIGARRKYATGKGNASKDAVLAAVITRYGHLLPVTGNDVADAVVFAAIGARHLGRPVEERLPAEHLKGMDAVAWPEVDR